MRMRAVGCWRQSKLPLKKNKKSVLVDALGVELFVSFEISASVESRILQM